MDDDLDRFYSSAYDEDERLRVPFNRLELLRTRQLLEPELPAPPARILDLGGGTGVHAAWLAEAGYDVELIDPVELHVEQAQLRAAESTNPFDAAGRCSFA